MALLNSLTTVEHDKLPSLDFLVPPVGVHLHIRVITRFVFFELLFGLLLFYMVLWHELFLHALDQSVPADNRPWIQIARRYGSLELGAQIEIGGNIAASGELEVTVRCLSNTADFLR